MEYLGKRGGEDPLPGLPQGVLRGVLLPTTGMLSLVRSETFAHAGPAAQ